MSNDGFNPGAKNQTNQTQTQTAANNQSADQGFGGAPAGGQEQKFA